MLSRSLLGLIMFLFVGILSGADAKSLSIEARFDALQEIIKSNWVLPEEERARLIADSYERSFRQEFAGRALEKLPDADLDFLYRAADATAFYAPREKYVEDMAAIVEVMQGEGLASERHYKGTTKACMRRISAQG